MKNGGRERPPEVPCQGGFFPELIFADVLVDVF